MNTTTLGHGNSPKGNVPAATEASQEKQEPTVESISTAQGIGNDVAGDVITVIRDPKPPLGKRFVLGADGKVEKRPQAETLFCYARMIRVPDHAALAKLLVQVAEDTSEALVLSARPWGQGGRPQNGLNHCPQDNHATIWPPSLLNSHALQSTSFGAGTLAAG